MTAGIDRGGRRGVLCAGSVLVDEGKVIDAYPPLDRLAIIDSITRGTGGAAINMAIDLRRLGAPFPVGLAGAIGDDANGALILAACERHGIDASELQVLPGAVTSFTDVMVERVGGRRTFFHHVGTHAAWDGSAVALDRSGARILHAGAPGVFDRMDARRPDGGNGWAELLARARRAGIRTNLEMATVEPAHNEAVVGPCLPLLDSIVVNELEAGALTGVDAVVGDPDGPVPWTALEAMATRLIGRGVGELAVVHTPAGAVAADASGRTWRQGSVRVPRAEIRSTTGAGDAFAAGILLGLHEGWPVERSLRLAVASAAACIRSPETSGGIEAVPVCLAAAEAAGFRSAG